MNITFRDLSAELLELLAERIELDTLDLPHSISVVIDDDEYLVASPADLDVPASITRVVVDGIRPVGFERISDAERLRVADALERGRVGQWLADPCTLS